MFFLLINVVPVAGQHEATLCPHWIYFTDKAGVDFNPFDHFDPLAIERRLHNGLPLVDSLDLPVREDYVAQVKALCDSLDGVSRWLNAAVVYATGDQLRSVALLPFVRHVEPVMQLQMAARDTVAESREFTEVLRLQTARMNGSAFRDSGFTGKGIRIAIFDVGFPSVDTHSAFRHIVARHGIIKTYDFSMRADNVFRGVGHGTAVLSCIAGMYRDSIPMGLATDAEFLLARTERIFTEWTAEEHRWIYAAEWADQNGAHIISSSLGYTGQRYAPQQMDGRTAPISRAANIAAAKGILVVNSAGNDGDTRWRTVGAPADADSVLTVGGTNPYTDIVFDFSSFGPTADHRLKPNVCAYGEAVTATKKDFGFSFGTSFACPLVAGFAACAMQAKPDLVTMEVFHQIEASGHLYPYFDYSHGYGIPLADKFLGTKPVIDTTFRFQRVGDGLLVTLDEALFPEDLGQLYEELIWTRDEMASHYQLPEGTPQKNLYYHVKDENGVITRYAVVLPHEKTPLVLHEGTDFQEGHTVTVHYEGFTDSIIMK